MTNAITSIPGGSGSANSGAAAGSLIASISAGNLGQKGPYRFRIRLNALAAGAAADVGNVILTVGGTTYPVPFTPAAGPQNEVVVDAVLDGVTAVTLNTGPQVSTIAYYGYIQAEFLGVAGSSLLRR